ncbi:hypothetical protein HYU09_00765 [Candidatus Woesearchaeota archaeon]|nr:hypothetical protein [Candidatus Woesearchaeota archaeon]
MQPVLKLHGVRGSIPAADRKFMEYGGNTSSYTLRTPGNSLVFLDAGVGILNALNELHNPVADRVVLALTHPHADHIQGLAMPNERGVEALPWLSQNEGYEGKKAALIGPKGIVDGLRAYYDKKFIWPVPLEWMPGIDFENVTEANEGGTFSIDDSTKVTTIYGNHPVATGVVLYRFDMQHDGQKKAFVFATDHEFDYVGPNKENPDADKIMRKYIEFAKGVDILLADAQYDSHQYMTGGPKDIRGFGHSHAYQIIGAANEAKVKKVVLTHHDRRDDQSMKNLDNDLQEMGRNFGLEVIVAKEGMEFRF